MKHTRAIRIIVMRKGERAYCRGFAQAVFFAAQRLITPELAEQFIRDGKNEDWIRQIDPATGELVTDYLPAVQIGDLYITEIRKQKGFEGEISRFWEKRYRDGFRDGWAAFRRGEVDLYEASLYRYQAARRDFKTHKHPITRESAELTATTLRAMDEMRDCDELRKIF